MDTTKTNPDQPRKPGRPHGAKQRPHVELMEERVDMVILRALRGTISHDPRTGGVAKDDKGKPIKKLPPAAWAKVAVQRIAAVRSGEGKPSKHTPDLEREVSVAEIIREEMAKEQTAKPTPPIRTIAQVQAEIARLERERDAEQQETAA